MGLQTPFIDCHKAAGAKIVDFGGWDMPLHYGSQIDEHHQVRTNAGMSTDNLGHTGAESPRRRQTRSNEHEPRHQTTNSGHA